MQSVSIIQQHFTGMVHSSKFDNMQLSYLKIRCSYYRNSTMCEQYSSDDSITCWLYRWLSVSILPRVADDIAGQCPKW